MAEKPSFSVTGSGAVTVQECNAMIQNSFQDPLVRFLRQSMEKAGCPVGDNIFRLGTCKEGTAGVYSPGKVLFVCCNNVRIQDEVTQMITHELIHAFDGCRAANLDWTDCAPSACAEI